MKIIGFGGILISLNTMKTEIIQLNANNPDADVIKKAAKLVRGGGLVVFPTETVYGIACRVEKDAIDALDQAKNRPGDKRYTLAIGDKHDVVKYVPSMSISAAKILEKVWPGPLTAVFDMTDNELETIKASMDKYVFEMLYQDGSIGIRCPQSAIATQLIKQANCEVVAPSANISGKEPAKTAAEAVSQLDGRVDMIIDGGPCDHGLPSSVVRLSGARPEILREGAIKTQEILDLSRLQILFVCTGNTCRSPMAEGVCSGILSEKIGCTLDQLSDFGYNVSSAGVMAINGAPASPEAIDAMKTRDIDISSHRSTLLTEELVETSDIIFVMGQAHRHHVLRLDETAENKCFLLDDTGDIGDPIGAGQEVYEKCAQHLEELILKRIGGIFNESSSSK